MGPRRCRFRCWKRAYAMQGRLNALEIPARFASDLAVANALNAAAKSGALENIRTNLHSIQDQEFKDRGPNPTERLWPMSVHGRVTYTGRDEGWFLVPLVGCAILACALCAQRPFRQYPAWEYYNFPLRPIGISPGNGPSRA